jgi:hypothetical protein
VVLFVFLLDFRIVPTVWYYLFFILSDAIKEYNGKKNYISEQLQKANQQIIETGKIDTTNTHIHDHSIFKIRTGTSEKVAGINLFYDLIE